MFVQLAIALWLEAAYQTYNNTGSPDRESWWDGNPYVAGWLKPLVLPYRSAKNASYDRTLAMLMTSKNEY